MTSFTDFNILLDNLVLYFTGSTGILALLICGIFFIVLLARGLDLRLSVTFILPLLGMFVAIGWFGDVINAQWIVNFALLIVALFYGSAVVKFMT